MTIDGVWYNELGSKMTVEATASGGLAGTYETKIGATCGQYPLFGSADGAGRAVGWVVGWVNDFGDSGSATSWSGQHQNVGGYEHLAAMWFLTQDSDPMTTWASTLSGKDFFTRTQPTPEDVALAILHVSPSHPAR